MNFSAKFFPATATHAPGRANPLLRCPCPPAQSSLSHCTTRGWGMCRLLSTAHTESNFAPGRPPVSSRNAAAKLARQILPLAQQRFRKIFAEFFGLCQSPKAGAPGKMMLQRWSIMRVFLYSHALDQGWAQACPIWFLGSKERALARIFASSLIFPAVW